MKFPLVYEINTRCWLRELSALPDVPVRLQDVPDAQLDWWLDRGFSHIWLMGLWPTGPRSRADALGHLALRRQCAEVLPGMSERDIGGSPYAVASYEIPAEYGGEAGLARFRTRLRQRGLKLMLDFVPNHVGLDHRWVCEHPEWFVRSTTRRRGTFRQPECRTPRWLAHGCDPYFAPWSDTVQVDYRSPAARAAMRAALLAVATRCDAARCDMAMLMLNDVFARTWAEFPSDTPSPPGEFWAEAIEAVKSVHPGFLFLGEVYWDLEAQLQSLGFDFTYEKRLYDLLLARDQAGVAAWVAGQSPESLARSAHFLENHDEPRLASKLPFRAHRAAALLTVGLPGLRLLHEGQLAGAQQRVPVQLHRRPTEPADDEIGAFYDLLLSALMLSSVGRGEPRVLETRQAWDSNSSHRNLVLIQWQAHSDSLDLVVVNLSSERAQCYAPLDVPGLERRGWKLVDLLGAEEYDRRGPELRRNGLYLDVPGHAAQLFHFNQV